MSGNQSGDGGNFPKKNKGSKTSLLSGGGSGNGSRRNINQDEDELRGVGDIQAGGSRIQPARRRSSSFSEPIQAIDSNSCSHWLICSCCQPSKSRSEAVVFRDELKRSTRRTIFACLAIVFLMNVGFSTLIPSIWFFVDALQPGSGCYLGLSISCFSLGQTIGSALLSLWYERSRHHLRLIFGLSLLCIFVGDLWYALSSEIWMLFLARLIAGFGAGNQEVIQGFVASITTPEDRPKHIASLSLFSAFGYIVGPGLAALLSLLSDQHDVLLNEYRSPALVSALLSLVCLVLVLLIHAPRRSKYLPAKELEDDDHWDKQGPRVSNLVTFALIAAYFFIFTTGSVYETITVPFTQCAYHWSLADNAALFAVEGFFGALTFVFMIFLDSSNTCIRLCHKLGRSDSEENVSSRTDFILVIPPLIFLAAGYGLMIIGDLFPPVICSATALNLPAWRFYLGSTLVTFAFPLSFSGLVNIFTRLLGRKSASYITLRMRLLKAGGYVARIIAPLWSGCVFEYRSFDLVFIVTSSGVLFAAFLLIIFSRYLIRLIDRIHSGI